MFQRRREEKRKQREIVQKHTNKEIIRNQMGELRQMRQESIDELNHHLIPFWKGMKDETFGGFYGGMTHDLVIQKEADKSCSSTSRILGFFSVCFWNLGNPDLLEDARCAYQFLKERFVDHENGGVYHMLDHTGKVKDDSKYTNEQAFAIYALAAYYDATREREALKLAKDIYQVIETRCCDEIGYISVFTKDFVRLENQRFSKKGIPASRTMHTLIHVLEGYTGLLKVLTGMEKKGTLGQEEAAWKEEIKGKIKRILDIIETKVYNHELGRQEAFFDEKYHSIVDLHPYGYDIETAWLIDQSVDLLQDETYVKRFRKISQKLVKTIYNTAFDGQSVDNECEEGLVDSRRTMWVQTEAVIGFLNAFQKENEHIEYVDAAKKEWQFIKNHMIDDREGSEWFNIVSKDGKPDLEEAIVDSYKCPYHNGRMCLEIIYRVSKLEEQAQIV